MRRVAMKSIKFIHNMNLVFTIAALLTAVSACANVSRQVVDASSQDWQEEFNIANRKLTSTGQSTYFILRPGFQSILASKNTRLTITVLDETKEINGVTTRVIEEREEKDGELSEVSRNYFAIDQETGDVFYFGEDVNFYDKGKVVDHEGTWMAYKNGNQPGLAMPGTPKVGMKYYQELAPDIAMDRAEVISISETFETSAGTFKNCLKTEESSKMKPTEKEYKMYAPDIGLVQDQSLKLISYGYIN
jgi:hypothetical protein